MNIGIIGSGKMGSGMGLAWIESGHDVCFSYSRDIRRLQAMVAAIGTTATLCTPVEAAQFGEVVLLAVHWPQVAGIAAEIEPHVGGKIVLTCVLPWNAQQTGLLTDAGTSAAEEIARLLPGACVAEALPFLADTIPATARESGSETPTVFYCSDDARIKATVAGLVVELGMAAVDAGSLRSARYLEPMAALLVHLAQDLGEEPQIAFKLLRR